MRGCPMDGWPWTFHRPLSRLSNLRELLPSNDRRTRRRSIVRCEPSRVSGFLHRNRHLRPYRNSHPSFEPNTTATSLRPSQGGGWAGSKRITAIPKVTEDFQGKFGLEPSSLPSVTGDGRI